MFLEIDVYGRRGTDPVAFTTSRAVQQKFPISEEGVSLAAHR